MKKTLPIILVMALFGSACSAEPKTVATDEVTETKQATQAVTEALPEVAEAKIADENMDLRATMYAMADQFVTIKQAESLDAMVEPTKQLATYASQAEVLAATDGKHANSAKVVEYMHQLRQKIALLQTKIDAGNIDDAKAVVADISSFKDMAHQDH